MRLQIIAALFVVPSLFGSVIGHSDEKQHTDMPDVAAPLRVAITVPHHHGHRTLNEGKCFHIVITNTSAKPVQLWTDRFSWGYDNLSFEQIGDDGAVTRIAKRPRDWSKNYPDWLELAPGDMWVINFDWFSAEGRAIWEHAPARDDAAKPKRVRLRSVYQVSPDDESEKLGVWTGKITSAEDTFAIW